MNNVGSRHGVAVEKGAPSLDLALCAPGAVRDAGPITTSASYAGAAVSPGTAMDLGASIGADGKAVGVMTEDTPAGGDTKVRLKRAAIGALS